MCSFWRDKNIQNVHIICSNNRRPDSMLLNELNNVNKTTHCLSSYILCHFLFWQVMLSWIIWTIWRTHSPPHQWWSCTMNYWRRQTINKNPHSSRDEWGSRLLISWLIITKTLLFLWFPTSRGCIFFWQYFDHCSCLEIHPLSVCATCM